MGSRRILIVDDEPSVLAVLTLCFRAAGYQVVTAPGAAGAIELCLAGQFDAILSDVTMPGMDGHGLARWVAQNAPPTFFVMMSGYQLECSGCPLARGCFLLQKPFFPQKAVEMLNRLLS